MRKKVLAERSNDRDPDRAWLGIERKYRVAEYESLSISLGASVSVDPGETIADATRRVFGQLRAEFGDIVEVMRGEEGV
jgi:hypothetical protein